jgi:anti-sigma-K factor RskA
MKTEREHILVQKYLAGDLDAEERWALEKDLEQDVELRLLLEEYRYIVNGLRDLGEPELPAHLWRERLKPALEKKLARKQSLWERLMQPSLGLAGMLLRPAAVIAFFGVVIAGVTIYFQSIVGEPSMSVEDKKAEEVISEFEQARLKALSELEKMTSEMAEKKQAMPEEMVAVYDETMRKLDAAIEEAERVYFANKYDDRAINLLVNAYKKKMQVIDQFMKMEL